MSYTPFNRGDYLAAFLIHLRLTFQGTLHFNLPDHTPRNLLVLHGLCRDARHCEKKHELSAGGRLTMLATADKLPAFPYGRLQIRL